MLSTFSSFGRIDCATAVVGAGVTVCGAAWVCDVAYGFIGGGRHIDPPSNILNSTCDHFCGVSPLRGQNQFTL